jgi:CDP-paratose 2-epimerase
MRVGGVDKIGNQTTRGGIQMKWIITGGSGFIGSNVVRMLHESGHIPIVIDDLSRPRVFENSNWFKKEFNIDTHKIDIRDLSSLKNVFKIHSDAQVVLHLAGQVSLIESIRDPRNDFEINSIGTLNVLESIRDHLPDAHLIFTSTNKVYGELVGQVFKEKLTRFTSEQNPGGFNEDTKLSPSGGYGVSNFAAELLISEWRQSYGVKSTILRQSSIYGPRQFSTSDQGWVAFFVECFLKNMDFEINGSGKQVRDILFVEDLYRLFLRIVELGADAQGIFNVGGGEKNSLSIVELFELLSAKTGNFPKFERGPMRPFDQLVFVSDNSRITKATGWRPEVSYKDGIDDLISWTRSNL